MAQKKPTVYDVAEAAGVSIATVSFAFSKPDRVKPDTRKTVLEAAARLGYVRSETARGLARGKTGAVGIYSYDYLLTHTRPKPGTNIGQRSRRFPLYSDEVQYGVESACHTAGLALMLGGYRTPAHIPRAIEVSGQVDGLIAFAGSLDSSTRRKITSQIPLVELGGTLFEDNQFTVYVDNYSAFSEMMLHLVLEHKFESLCFLGEASTAEFSERYRAFTDVLAKFPNTRSRTINGHAGDDSVARKSLKALLASGDIPEVIVCDSDQNALAAMDYLFEHGLSVPGDIAVTGFDGILAGQVQYPRLTTCVQPMHEIGATAIEIIAEVLGGSTPSHTPDTPLRTCVSYGDSCGC